MYYSESESFALSEPELTDKIHLLDEFVAARSQKFFLPSAAENHTDIDWLSLQPILEFFVAEGIVVEQTRFECNCGHHFLINALGRGYCDICNLKLSVEQTSTSNGFFVARPPRFQYNSSPESALPSNTLTGSQMQSCHLAIQAAFNEEHFERFLHFNFDKRLSDITSTNASFSQKIYQVLNHFNEQGTCKDFVKAASTEIPTNVKLRNLITSLS